MTGVQTCALPICGVKINMNSSNSNADRDQNHISTTTSASAHIHPSSSSQSQSQSRESVPMPVKVRERRNIATGGLFAAVQNQQKNFLEKEKKGEHSQEYSLISKVSPTLPPPSYEQSQTVSAENENSQIKLNGQSNVQGNVPTQSQNLPRGQISNQNLGQNQIQNQQFSTDRKSVV